MPVLVNMERATRLVTCRECGTDLIGRSVELCPKCAGQLVVVTFSLLNGQRQTYGGDRGGHVARYDMR